MAVSLCFFSNSRQDPKDVRQVGCSLTSWCIPAAKDSKRSYCQWMNLLGFKDRDTCLMTVTEKLHLSFQGVVTQNMLKSKELHKLALSQPDLTMICETFRLCMKWQWK